MNLNDIKLLSKADLGFKKGKQSAPAFIRVAMYDKPSINTGLMYFNVDAATLCDIARGRFIHFANPGDGKEWYFVVNDDATGCKIADHGSGYSVRSKKLIQRFEATTKATLPAKYYTQDTGEMLGRDKLYEILTHKTISKIGR